MTLVASAPGTIPGMQRMLVKCPNGMWKELQTDDTMAFPLYQPGDLASVQSAASF